MFYYHVAVIGIWCSWGIWWPGQRCCQYDVWFSLRTNCYQSKQTLAGWTRATMCKFCFSGLVFVQSKLSVSIFPYDKNWYLKHCKYRSIIYENCKRHSRRLSDLCWKQRYQKGWSICQNSLYSKFLWLLSSWYLFISFIFLPFFDFFFEDSIVLVNVLGSRWSSRCSISIHSPSYFNA